MAENLLNIGLYANKASEQSSTLKKAYVDNKDSAFSFDKVFDSANKVYGSDRNSFNASTANKTADKFVEKENFNKVDEKKSHEDSSRIKEKDHNADSHKDEVSKKSDDAADSDNSKDSDKKNETEENSKKSDDSQSGSQEKVATKTAVDAIMGQAVAMLTNVEKAVAQVTEAASQTEQVANVAGANIDATMQAVKEIAAEKKLDVDLSKMTQMAKDMTGNKNVKAKVQAEVQQLLLKIAPEQNVAQDSTKTQGVAEEAKAQSPLIQASAEAVAGAAKLATPKKVLVREMLEKAVLTQELMEKTNAIVVGVENSATSGNLLNQQNAKEQGVKMSLGSIDNVGNISGAANMTGTSSQVTFDKKLEVAQAPKELNKADILSQIHTKFENIKDDGTTKVTIILKPENLGKISLELINGKDGFTAKMTADNAQVKELLDKNLDSLKSSLASQGVNVGSVTVKVAETEKQSNDMFTFDQRQQETGENQSQTSSNGSHNQGESYGGRNAQGYFEEEIVNNAQSANPDDSGSRLSHDGQVDYKI